MQEWGNCIKSKNGQARVRRRLQGDWRMNALRASRICCNACCLIVGLLIFGASVEYLQAQQPGVSEQNILIGSCSALDGPARFLGNQTVLGASAYLHSINDQGGVFGRKIQLMAFDDGYDPDKAPACFKRLVKEGVFALGFFVGTPTAKVYVPMAQEEKMPVVGLFTGAQMLYEPLKHYVINVRASYYDETREQVDKLWDEGKVRKIGVIYQDDAFGKTVLDGVKLALQKHGSAPTATGSFARNTMDVDAGLKAVMASRPEAVLVGPYAPVAGVRRDLTPRAPSLPRWCRRMTRRITRRSPYTASHWLNIIRELQPAL
jgi:branched-chain amino acid transport system substrate-binding protein